MSNTLIWAALAVCVTQSAMLSGLNLAVFSLSRLRLEAAADAGDSQAERVLSLRRDAHFTLVTILLGNVAINVLLTLLADSVLPAVGAFLFSTFAITLFGEIVPQAYFTRHALRVIDALLPILRFYQLVLWPIARPVGRMLDYWVGPEGLVWFREAELRDVLRHHARHAENEVSRLEAIGAMNFLDLDDLRAGTLGYPVTPDRVFTLPFRDGLPVMPAIERLPKDRFLRELGARGDRWLVIADESGEPRLLLDPGAFLREALYSDGPLDLAASCRPPVIVSDDQQPLGEVLGRMTAEPGVAEVSPILVWAPENHRIIDGSHILERLLIGTADRARDGAGFQGPPAVSAST
jgi:metal transporter CNNM